MLCNDRPWLAFFLGASLVLIWTFGFDVHDEVERLVYGQGGVQQDAESVFLQQAEAVEFPAPIDYAPIQEICARTSFRPGLLFTCEGQHGGIGMVRNQMLKCIRYAIHGGGAIVVPSMSLRSASDLSDIENSNLVGIENLFDRQTFVTHLSQGCPGMRVYERAENFPSYERVASTLNLVGHQFEPDHPKAGLQHPWEWRRSFDAWLDQQNVHVRPDAPVHIKMQQSYLEYPVHDDGDAAHEFGKLLSFRNDTRAMAAKVLYELRRQQAPGIDPAKPVNEGAFFGAHLRLEDDAVWAWQPDEWRFSRMKDQFEEHFRYLARTGLTVVYAACGNQSIVDIFAERLRAHLAADPTAKTKNVTVVTKYDLLTGADRRQLDTFSFDQQGLVDFLIMFKASAFMGVAHSSFSWNVALRRHELSRYAEYGNEGSDLLRDEYSIIMGMEADYPHVDNFVNAIWP